MPVNTEKMMLLKFSVIHVYPSDTKANKRRIKQIKMKLSLDNQNLQEKKGNETDGNML